MIIDPGMKTPLKKVKGFGAAKSGTDHFWQQRATAVANLPLVGFMVGFVIYHLVRPAPRSWPRCIIPSSRCC